MKTAVIRKEHFNAAHQLQVSDWSEEENQRIFGKCYNPNFHGHNYELFVKVIGEPDPVTGYLIDLKNLSELIKENILDRFDHGSPAGAEHRYRSRCRASRPAHR